MTIIYGISRIIRIKKPTTPKYVSPDVCATTKNQSVNFESKLPKDLKKILDFLEKFTD